MKTEHDAEKKCACDSCRKQDPERDADIAREFDDGTTTIEMSADELSLVKLLLQEEAESLQKRYLNTSLAMSDRRAKLAHGRKIVEGLLARLA